MKFDSCVPEKKMCTGAVHRALFAARKDTFRKPMKCVCEAQVHLLLTLAGVWTKEHLKSLVLLLLWEEEVICPEDFMIQCLILQKCRDVLNPSEVSSSDCFWKWGGGPQRLVQGWGTCISLFRSLLMDQTSGFCTATRILISRWGGLWMDQLGSSHKWGFSHLQKSS